MPQFWPRASRGLTLTPTVAAGWALSGVTVTELRIEGRVATLVWDLVTTSAQGNFSNMCSWPTDFWIGSGSLMSLWMYRASDAAQLGCRVYANNLQAIAGSIASGTRMVGAATWVLA